MSEKVASRRFTIFLAVLVLFLAAPLGPPAFSNHAAVAVGAVLDSTELLGSLDSQTDPRAEITYEVFFADGDGLAALASATSSHNFGTVGFHLEPGNYKIRAISPGFLESWYTSSAGSSQFSISELLTYQERRTFATADVIVVDASTPGNSSWTHDGWTVLHRNLSSISGAVASEASGQAGTLLPGVAVELHDEAAVPGAPLADAALTDENGYYSFEDVAPGSYTVKFVSGGDERWWPETTHRAEAEVITLDGATNFNLAYAVFPAVPVTVDPGLVLGLSGEPALGATLTADPGGVPHDAFGEDCLQRYAWFLDDHPVAGAFGPEFVVPLDAGGKLVHARLDIAGIGCTYTALLSNSVGPVDPGLTLAGTDVIAAPVDDTGQTPAMLTFGEVTVAGSTTVTRLVTEDAPPAGSFSSLLDPPLYYDIETDAVFNADLGVQLCIRFDTTGMTEEQSSGQRLYHYVNGGWEDITTSSSPGQVCGLTHSFSPFAVGYPHWPFRGFLEPVNADVPNAMPAGAAVPIKFSVGGDRGLDILPAGSPSSVQVVCADGSVPDDVEQTVAAGSSSLSYAAGTETYTYVWKTQKAWTGTCRQFTLRLMDGTAHTAIFDFRK